MKGKIIAKLVLSSIIVLIGLIQIIVCISMFMKMTGGGALAGMSMFVPMIAGMPLFIVGIVDLIVLIKAIMAGCEKMEAYRTSYNTVLCIVSSILIVIFGAISLVSGAIGFFIGAIAEGYGDTIYLVALGEFYAVIAPIICVVLLAAEIITSVIVAKHRDTANH